MLRYRDIIYEVGNQTFNGSWHVEGDKLLVSSTYGSRSEDLGQFAETPAVLAKVMLGQIVLDWARR